MWLWEAEIWYSYSIAHLHKMHVINHTLQASPTLQYPWGHFPCLNTSSDRALPTAPGILHVSVWNNSQTCLRKESKLYLIFTYQPYSCQLSNKLHNKSVIPILKRQNYSDKKHTSDGQELKGLEGVTIKGVLGGHETILYPNCGYRIYVVKFMELYTKKF